MTNDPDLDRVPLLWVPGAILAPGLTIFALPTLQLIAQNEEFLGSDYGAGKKLYMAGVGLSAIGVCLWRMRRWRVGRSAFYGHVLLAPAWVLYSLVGASGHLTLAVAILLAVAIAATGLGRRPRRFAMGNLAMISTIATVALAASTFATLTGPGASPSSSTAPPSSDHQSEDPLPNVYHLVLDMFQTELFEYHLDGQLRQELGGFTMYEDNRVEYGRTHMSMASLYAGRSWDGENAYTWMFESMHGEDSALTRLESAGYHTMGWVNTLLAYGIDSPFDSYHVSADLQNPVQIEAARLAETLWLYGNLPSAISKRVLEPAEFAMLQDNSLQPDSAPAAAPPTMAEFIEHEDQLSGHSRYTLIHLMVPHVPYVLDSDCKLVEDGTDVIRQSACTLELIQEFLDALKRLDRFDDATIVIHGDHGASYDLVSGEIVKVGDDRESLEWNDARSRSLLLIKPSGTDDSRSLERSDRPTMVTDVMPTILDSIGMNYDGPGGRASVLADSFPDRTVRYFNFYGSRDGSPEGPIRRYAITQDGIRLERVIDA